MLQLAYKPVTALVPFPAAVAWISQTHIDYGHGMGEVVVHINQDIDCANAMLAPIGVVRVNLGQRLQVANDDGTITTYTFATLPEIVASAASIAEAQPDLDPFGCMRLALFQALQEWPDFLNATMVGS